MNKVVRNYLNAFITGLVGAVVLFLLLFILTACPDNNTIRVDGQNVTKVYNTYVTELYEEYQITNVTEQYITEEYYEVTNINGAQIEIVPLCPNLAGNFPEVLLRIDGVLVAYFAQNGDALKARLVVVPENTALQTTDGRNCKFKVVNQKIVEL